MLTYYASKHLTGMTVRSLGRTKFDCLKDDLITLEDEVAAHGGVVTVVNCIGAIPQKKFNNEEFTQINVTFPHRLAQFCVKQGWRLIHISTNCVFSGQKDKCTEVDTPDAPDIYGKTKKDGEPDYGLVIRCSIIGPERHSYTGLMEWFLHSSDSSVSGYTDSYWNGLTTLELSKIIVEHVLNDNWKHPLLHYYSGDTVSKYDILTFISDIFKKRTSIKPVQYGLKYYTLSSGYTQARKPIYEQLTELEHIIKDYNEFYCV